MKRIGILHLVDTLDVAGQERATVNLANHTPKHQYRTSICTTRREGPLARTVESDVERICLARSRTVDWKACERLIGFIREQSIQILHAHGDSVFIARLASFFRPFPRVIFHVHRGSVATKCRPMSNFLYRLATRGAAGVITVNHELSEWARKCLGFPHERVWHLPNLAYVAGTSAPSLPGRPGRRIVCVGNIRPEKDHVTLIRAMARVVADVPDAHLLIVGAKREKTSCFRLVTAEIVEQGLEQHVSLLGARDDVAGILKSCDVGVLSSTSEGLPVSLLEYGLARLPSVVTRVGECAEVVDQGRAGLVVPARAPEEMAKALFLLLQSSEKRKHLGDRFCRWVNSNYSPGRIITQVCRIYEAVLSSKQVS